MFCQIQLCFVILYVIFCASVCRNIDLLSLVVFLVAIYAVFSTQWMQLLLWDPSCSPRKRSQIHDYLHLQLMYESDIITWNVQKNKESNYHLTTIYNITIIINDIFFLLVFSLVATWKVMPANLLIWATNFKRV